MLDKLYVTLGRRLRPEDVAQIILEGLGADLTPGEFKLLEKAAAHSLKRAFGRLTSMSEDFFEALPPERQVRKAQELFKTAASMTAAECADVQRLRGFVAVLSTEIKKAVGHSSFKYDRLDRKARDIAGLDLSKRRYNKLFRFLVRFEHKIESYRKEVRRADLRHVAKSGLVGRISRADFESCGAAAPFVAYIVARLNRRSMFTNVGQDRAFDEIAAMLFGRFKRAPNSAGWRVIAYVMPDLDFVSHLSDADKTRLFADWLSQLKIVAETMKECWDEGGFDRAGMIVRKGQDSSTWNAAAGAWNVARQGWLGVLHALGMEDVVDLVCPGKAMRLMAADVAHWHQASGGTLHPDTAVWAALPAPWEVFTGQAACTRADVEAACAKVGVDPAATGWTMPRHSRKATPFHPTPELVHGVEISHPELAAMLRKAGWFSGKRAEALPKGVAAIVVRDATGAAIRAEPNPVAVPTKRNWLRFWSKSDGV